MELILNKEKCNGCGACIDACPFSALIMKEGYPEATEECRLCGLCVNACPEEAISLPEELKKKKRPIKKARDVWVYAEHRDGKLARVSFELLGKGRELADKLGQKLVAILIGHQIETSASRLIDYGADIVYVMDHPDLATFNENKYGAVLIPLLKKHCPNIFLSAATTRGRSLIPQIAADLETGLTADCTGLDIDSKSGLLLQTRPAFGGNIMALITCPDHRPQMATVRPHIFPKPQPIPNHKGKIIRLEIENELPENNVKVKSFIKTETKGPDLSEADVIIGVGRGIKGPENLKMMEELAYLLNASIGGSRAVVDAGWLPPRCQIGQTGVTVSPKIYIACGISGAIQHIVGIQSAKTIVAINKDPDAPIFNVANYGIVADLFEFIPKLIEEIKKGKGELS
ncbi:MAG: Caffeyl-CoA reductase-Etf complex subunit CarE [Candidatus Methanoperedenaceae archaeon GB50]|nr:MAG: Caffeyl-CoA reductase-Etf complex subunit CarE [Candidatus Methanoperedenaceae archaeon GB50]